MVPGTGQLVAGAKLKGYILLGIAVPVLVIAILVILFALEDPDEFIASLIDPALLLWIFALDIALGVFRAYAVVDAMVMSPRRWSLTGGRTAASEDPAGAGTYGSRARVWNKIIPALTGTALVLVLGVTVWAQVMAGQWAYAAYDTLSTTFSSEQSTTSTSAPTSTSMGSGTVTSLNPASTTTTLPPVTPNAGEDGRLTILISGSDAGVGRTGGRADTNIVASFDLETGRIALFSIPRNTGNAPLSEEAQDVMGMRYYSNWLTGLYGSAQRYPQLAPEGGDPGAVVMRDTISIILGLEIDYYMVVDMLGFVELVDMMGGVSIYVDDKLHMSISPPTEEEDTLVYDLEPGVNVLDGRMALAFARTRKDSSDYVRMGRQRCVILALLDQTGMTEIMWNFSGIMGVIKRSVSTDIPVEAIQELVRLRSKLQTGEMISIGFIPPKYTSGLNGNKDQLGWILNYKLIRETVQQVLEHPEEILVERDDAGLDSGDCWKKPREQ